jgi:hypothetical protein
MDNALASDVVSRKNRQPHSFVRRPSAVEIFCETMNLLMWNVAFGEQRELIHSLILRTRVKGGTRHGGNGCNLHSSAGFLIGSNMASGVQTVCGMSSA